MLLAFAAVVLLASCRSSKKMASGTTAPTQPTTTVTTPDTPKGEMDEKRAKIMPGTNFTSKVKVTLTQDGKSMGTTGTLRMRYDDVIQITLVDPLLGIAEIGRMELSPDRMLVIDRINKRYVDTTYEDFKAMKDNNISFTIIQDLFWKEAQTADAVSYTIPAKTPIKLDLKLSDKGNSANWNAHSTVSDKYERTDVNRLFSSFANQ